MLIDKQTKFETPLSPKKICKENNLNPMFVIFVFFFFSDSIYVVQLY